MNVRHQPRSTGEAARPIDWTSTDRAYLVREKGLVDLQAAEIRAKLAEARRVFASGGRPLAPNVMRRMEEALAIRGAMSQRFQARLAELRAVEEAANVASSATRVDTWHQSFVRIAKHQLQPDEFARLAAMTDSVVAARSPEAV